MTVTESDELTRTISALKKKFTGKAGAKGEAKTPAKKDKKVKFASPKDLSKGQAPTDPEVGYLGYRDDFPDKPKHVQDRIHELHVKYNYLAATAITVDGVWWHL
jgi:hypothetical protein